MKIAVTGGTGFIGQHLIDSLIGQGHQVFLISRHEVPSARAGVTSLTWHGLEQDVSVLEGVDAIVNLAGETINQRWTVEAKGRILASRVVVTRRVASIVARLQNKPQVVVNGSGTSDPEQRDENTVTLLADVVREWEKAADEIQGVRVVKLR
ncbi:MAG: NAD-dependent epimerase/dehydratase family protein, partial [Tumebacillaceae bacterium]